MAVRQVYYSAGNAKESNRCIETVPIIINDVGVEYFYAPFTSHSSRMDFGLVYVVSGTMRFTRSDGENVLNEGGFFIGPPHREETGFGTDGDYLNYYWLNFTGSRAASLIEQMGFQYNKAYTAPDTEEIGECFRKIFSEFHINDRFFAPRSEAALVMLLSTIARAAEGGKREHLKSVEYIHEHYNEDISVAQLAHMEKFSYSHYHNVFKKVMGMSPQEYITTQRMNTACFYLLESNHSIGEISELTGYPDQCYFSRLFKKKMGISPQEYRKSKGEIK